TPFPSPPRRGRGERGEGAASGTESDRPLLPFGRPCLGLSPPLMLQGSSVTVQRSRLRIRRFLVQGRCGAEVGGVGLDDLDALSELGARLWIPLLFGVGAAGLGELLHRDRLRQRIVAEPAAEAAAQVG